MINDLFAAFFIAELFLKPLLVLGLLTGFESEVESDDLYFSIGVDLTVFYFESGLCSKSDDDASQSYLRSSFGE